MVERIALSVAEAAEAVGVSARTMYDWLHKPGFPARKVGGRRLILADELKEWLKQEGGGQE